MTSNFIGAVLATLFILIAYGFMRAQAKVIDLTANVIANRDYIRKEQRSETLRLKLIVDRLDLRNSILPNPTVGIYSAVCDLYDSVGMSPYKLPIEAADQHNVRWLKNIKDFENTELFQLWLSGIVD